MTEPSGRLTREKTARILTDLLNSRYVGVFTIRDAESVKEFYFAGSGVKATSVGPRKSLPVGRFWVCSGAISEETLSQGLAMQDQAGPGADLIGNVLVGIGLLEESKRDLGLFEQLVEELTDVFFWPNPEYSFKPGHQTRVGSADKLRDQAGIKSLSFKTNLPQAITLAKTQGKTLGEAGRKLGGLGASFKVSAKARDLLFTREKFAALHPSYRVLIPLLAKPRTLGEIIESGKLPWSYVLSGLVDCLASGLLEPA